MTQVAMNGNFQSTMETDDDLFLPDGNLNMDKINSFLPTNMPKNSRSVAETNMETIQSIELINNQVLPSESGFDNIEWQDADTNTHIPETPVVAKREHHHNNENIQDLSSSMEQSTSIEYPSLPDQFVITLPTIIEIEPAEVNKYPKISIYVKSVSDYTLKSNDPINKKTVLLFHGTMETAPNMIDPQHDRIYRAYVAKKEGGGEVDEEWHFTVWASMQWWVACTGTESVRIRVWNNSHKAYGGYQWYPFIPERTVWLRPPVPNFYHIVEPDMKIEKGQVIGTQIKKKKVPSFWTNRGGENGFKLLNPDIDARDSYSAWDLYELGYVNTDTSPEVVNYSTNGKASDVVQTLVNQVVQISGEEIKKQITSKQSQKRTRKRTKNDTTRETSFESSSENIFLQ